MSIDQPESSKRQRFGLPSTSSVPTPATAADTSVGDATDAATLPSPPPPPPSPPTKPVVRRGRPAIPRSPGSVQAATLRLTCSVCGKLLHTASKLERHQRTHTGQLPFACAVCDKRFSDQHNAARHQQRCKQRQSAEEAIRSTTLSWPLWRQQPDEEEEWEVEAADRNEQESVQDEDAGASSSSKRGRRANDTAAARLPRLNRWLFPQQLIDTTDGES